ncbi:sperm-associated antigen 8 isoform 1-T1 [Synchiropus picturatus]
MAQEAVKTRLCKILRHNWVEERAVLAIDSADTWAKIQKYGHRGILTVDQNSKMESVTTQRAYFAPPKGPGVRLKGVRKVLKEKEIAEMISEKLEADSREPPPKTDFCTTTKRDFGVEGFVPAIPLPKKSHDYTKDQAVTFWSENYKKIHGVTNIRIPTAPFNKWAKFSTPISERLEEVSGHGCE